MKHPRWLALTRLGLFALVGVALSSCGRKVSPQAARQERLNWTLKTSVGAYQQTGHTDPRWDEPATRALTEYAQIACGAHAPDEESTEIISTNCIAAIQAGCDDPLIRYLYARFWLTQTNSAQDVAKAYSDAALDLQKTSYPSIRKLYASLRAMEQIYFAYGTNSRSVPALREIWASVGQDTMSTIQDKTLPPDEAYEVCSATLKAMAGGADAYAQAYSSMEGIIFANWPDESTSWLLKGEAYYQMAWHARGGGYANGVSAEGWKTFGEKLAVAEKALKKAWKLDPKDPRVPTFMIRVAEGQQKSRDEMELWFGRAMALNPNNYDACHNKLHYLYPQWYGSREAMIAFGRECVAADQWGGSVPLILVDAHYEYSLYALPSDEEREAYWKRPEVWPDIKAAYERFFTVNPGSAGVYKNYAWYAFHAGQWEAFLALVPEVRPIDYDYFGGKEEFDKMVQLAKGRLKQ